MISPDASAASAVISGLIPGETYDVSLSAYVTTYDHDAIYVEEWDYYDPGYADHCGEASDIVTVSSLSENGGSSGLSFFRKIIEKFKSFFQKLVAFFRLDPQAVKDC